MTCCLRTRGDTLSVWHIEKEEYLDEAVLAIASNQAHLETIDIVILDDDYVVKCMIDVQETEGDTPVVDLKRQHRDLVKLNLRTLGVVAEHIVESIKNSKHKRYREKELKKIITTAISNKRLDINHLKEDVRKKLVEHL